ncbi:hypothetical protein UB37_20385 [Photobacterium iliopiscarium]|uniref:Uncharacterized protein n=1 Tax=Photobacterium iliopiscarium TaxID=56192 RepID=A0ABX5GM64_9GAMM|nr:hypothetical protein [Photobacterium iliopiscarium]KJG15058.1 hypothetical protein UB37_20385 [Photobacterium iliopiscarium]PSW90483.1 hypothetical protein C9J52_19705 [Photobacterium iliopiscarium]
MKLLIDDVTFNFEHINTITKERHSASYQLQGMDCDLIKWAVDSCLSKTYFNVRVIKGSEEILLGECCSFNKINNCNGTAQLIVNWVVS